MVTVYTTSGKRQFKSSIALEESYPKRCYDYIRANGYTYILPRSN